MKRIGIVLFVLSGAFLGGIFPGGIVAFSLLQESGSEAAWVIGHLLFGVVGSLGALCIGKAYFQGRGPLPGEALTASAAGLVAGVVGYCWMLWQLLQWV
jgi:hypothetical protein